MGKNIYAIEIVALDDLIPGKKVRVSSTGPLLPAILPVPPPLANLFSYPSFTTFDS